LQNATFLWTTSLVLGKAALGTFHNIRRILFHTLDEGFCSLEPGDNPYHQELASVKKLRKGDGFWQTHKLMLGWIIDTLRMTARLNDILPAIPRHQQQTSVCKLQQVLGELRSMVIAIPGFKGLFSLLQEALPHQSNKRLCLNHGVHDCLGNF
jgi:hypothetical protein